MKGPEMSETTDAKTAPVAPSTATLVLERLEAAALVSACLTILTELINRDGRDLFPDVARPLFSSYTKLCALSNHKADLRVLRVACRTWGGWEGEPDAGR